MNFSIYPMWKNKWKERKKKRKDTMHKPSMRKQKSKHFYFQPSDSSRPLSDRTARVLRRGRRDVLQPFERSNGTLGTG